MKITIDLPPLTYGYLAGLVARGDFPSVEEAVDSCFTSKLAEIYEADLAAGRLPVID